MTYMKECPKCHREFQTEHKKATVCPDCKRVSVVAAVRRWKERNRENINAKTRERLKTDTEFRLRMREQARRRYAAKHPKREHYCIECGRLLSVPNAKRCPSCAQEKQRETMREWARKKRAEIKAEKEKSMDEAIIRSKKANVKIEKYHRERDLDARQKAAQEKKRIAASIVMMKEIYARRQAEKRKKRVTCTVAYPHVCDGDCAAWTRRDWW